MTRLLYRFAAECVFLIHLFVVIIAVFGWALPIPWFIYTAILVGTLSLGLLLKYCILSKWEFDLRKKTNKHIYYDYTWTTYYTHKLTKHYIPKCFFERVSLFFWASLCLLIFTWTFFLKISSFIKSLYIPEQKNH